MNADTHVSVQGQILTLTADAVLFQVGHGMSRHSAWIPRASVHEAERPGLDRMTRIDRVALRIETEMAREKGLISARQEGGAVADLFGESK